MGMSSKDVCKKHDISPGTLRNLVANKNTRGVFDNEPTGAKIGRIPTLHDGVRDVSGGYGKLEVVRKLTTLACSGSIGSTTGNVPPGSQT